jgi:hypothetical protein
MKKTINFIILAAIMAILSSGCVERRLTINTSPTDAKVILNDEYIGTSPVTVSFNWYGTYNIRIEKDGFTTLDTHRKLNAPWYDHFPFDFFAQISPKKTVDTYDWSFELSPAQLIDRQQLIENAQQIRDSL